LTGTVHTKTRNNQAQCFKFYLSCVHCRDMTNTNVYVWCFEVSAARSTTSRLRFNGEERIIGGVPINITEAPHEVRSSLRVCTGLTKLTNAHRRCGFA